jgi:hypothetical protein
MQYISLKQRCAQVLAAALVLLLPVVMHAQDVKQIPVDKPAGEPKIVFENPTHDFGTVQPNTPLTHSFVFANQGTAPLLIEKVKAG